MSTLDIIIQWLLAYKYLALFPIMVVEGPIVTVIAGFLASLGYMNVLLVYFIVVAGDLTGDVFYYALGRYGREKTIARWGHVLGITMERIERVEYHFKNHTAKTLLFGKLTHAIGLVFLVAAGMARVPFSEYLWYNLLGTLPKSLVFLLIGYYFGSAYVQINNYLSYGMLGGIFFIGLLFLIYFIYGGYNKIGESIIS